MQVYGFLEKAQLENVAGDLANTLSGLIWFDTASSRAKFYDSGAIRTVVDENSTQTITGKTLTGNTMANFSPDGVESIVAPVVSGNMLVDQHQLTYMDALHQATPASPSAGVVRIYSKNDNQLYKLDSEGNEIAIGTGGGGLDVFHIEDFETNNVADFSSGNNATFLGGGVLAGSLTDVVTIAGARNLRYTQVAGSLNDFFASPVIDIFPKQAGNDSGVTLYFTYSGDADDMKVVIYDVDNTKVISSVLDLIPDATNPTRYSTSIFVPKLVTQLRWGAQVVVENIGAVLELDDVQFSSDPFVYKNLTNDTKWIAFTPSTSDLGTITGASGFYRQVGDSMEVFANFVAGVVSGGTAGFDIPISRSMDLNKLNAVSGKDVLGSSIRSNGANSYYSSGFGGIITHDASDATTVRFSSAASASGSLAIATGSGYASTGDGIHVHFTVPILGWTVNSENVVSPANANQKAVYGAGNAGTAITANVTNIDFTETVDLGNYWNGTQYLAPATANYIVNGHISLTANVNMVVSAYVDGVQNSLLSGNVASQPSHHFSGTIRLQKGETLSIRVDSTVTLSNSAVGHHISIIRDSDAAFLAAVPVQKVAFVKQIETSGTNGGTFTAGSYQTRVLNTLEGDTSFMSLSSNQMTIQPGEYLVEGAGMAYQVDTHQMKLYNISDSLDAIIGTTTVSGTSVGVPGRIDGSILLTSIKVFEVRHRCQTTKTNNGFGIPGSYGSENFATIKITKLR